ncbi:MAG: hypothetical protein AAFR11_05535 [Pseudomonadota bacterium]
MIWTTEARKRAQKTFKGLGVTVPDICLAACQNEYRFRKALRDPNVDFEPWFEAMAGAVRRSVMPLAPEQKQAFRTHILNADRRPEHVPLEA